MAVVAPPPPPPPLEPPAASEIPPAPEPAAVATAPDPAEGRQGTIGQAGGEQLAARPAAALGPDPVRLGFEEGSAELSDQARVQLTALKDLLLANETQRVQLRAYAKGGEQQAIAARRLSLSRARTVRAFLTEQGVSSSRIDIRALGATFRDGPPDRVDVVYAKR
jgi:outer membrane protein OmpA-like peptidoglycan-associated protein